MSEAALAPVRFAPDAAVRMLMRAGAETSMVEDFRTLAEATAPTGAPRYGRHTVLEPLARFLVRGSAGANRDAALYELCHLVAAVDACGVARDRRNAFFLGPESASPARFRARLDRTLTKGGWRRPGFAQVDHGVAITQGDVAFTIHYGRMPFLAALYEFLAGLENFAFYAELQAIFDEMTAGKIAVRSLQAASNRVASHLRQYRRRNLSSAQHDGKFELLLGFLKERSPHGRLVVDDASVLDFWCGNSGVGDFRTYRTVFDAFTTFIRALEETQRAEAMASALPIGTDRDNGEIEPDDTAATHQEPGTWISPLAALDEEPAAAIKFFKRESERKPIEALMHYGPTAIRLPLAFLRLDTFGPIQSAITTDLQVGRHAATRISCDDAPSYPETVATLTRILEFVRRLQKATFYALHSTGEGGCSAEAEEGMADLVVESAKAFRAVARKGFDAARLQDEQRQEGFRIGAEALVAAADQIVRYLKSVRGRPRHALDLESQFTADREIFSRKFRSLYEVLQ